MRAAFFLTGIFGSALLAVIAVDDAKNRPVAKVITLLKDMITQLEKEAETDQDVYETMGCWCETNDKEKTKSISDAQQHIQDLTASIEQLSAKSAELNTAIENLEGEVQKNSEALDQATALRTKQLAEFNEEEKGMLQSVSALKSAVIVMSKKQEAESYLQDSSTATLSVVATMEKELRVHKDLLREVITPEQRRKIRSFAQDPDAFLQSESSSQSSAPSAEIYGMLKQMKETFETNLAASQREETENQHAYEDVKSAKKAEIAAGQSQLDTKTEELAATDQKNAASKEDSEDTQASLEADTKFLADLKDRCAAVDQEFEMRVKERQAEIQATSKALEFLSSDEAHELMGRTFNFIQERRSQKQNEHIRRQVGKLLREVARRTGDPRLSALEVGMRMDAFGKIKTSIQNMVDNLLQEKDDEGKHRDFCIGELNTNERDTENKQRDKDDIQAKLEDLKMSIDEVTRELETLKMEIAEMQVQMKRGGEDREKENRDFQLTIADQRATTKLLGAALGVLKGFYDKAAFVQQQHAQGQSALQKNGQAPPPSFKPMEKNAGGGGVMGMIQQIINDAKGMEAAALHGEEDSQKGYERFVKNTNDAVEEKAKDLLNKGKEKAKLEIENVQARESRDVIMQELEQLYNANADLHKSCDYILKNFETRELARDEEIEALKQSISMFSGASFGALLQGHPDPSVGGAPGETMVEQAADSSDTEADQ